ncbi:translocation/assembly module TamB domain-containing protein [Algoriphagus mannitolivorans]|uniref:translocation/assembly module TamB domain-containing protein n=1 Tax=Algoriphagus mannitolivorans TaxID=226504 RepID=UPI0012FC88C2|nr:translocation/assembly module TamB domain-containing protein [Algoriphagus mannitolivorans]
MLAWLIFSTLLLFITLALALQITTVQNWVIDKVTGYLNKNSSFTTEIGEIKLNWWDALELNQLSIRDEKDSLMIGADRAHVDFALLSLIPPGDPTIDFIRLEKAKVQLLTHSGDSSMNINRWVVEINELLGAKSSSTTKTKFYISAVELRQSEFSLINFNTEPISAGMDYNRLRFAELSGNATNFRIEGSQIGIDLKMLSGVELNSGLQIRELKTLLTYDPKFLELDRLSLRTDRSHIKEYLRFDLIGPKGFGQFLDQVKITARMEETKINVSDLNILVSAIPQIEDEVYLSGEIIGTVSDLKSEEFLIRIGKKTALFGSFYLDGLPDFEKTYMNISLKNSVISARDLAPYLPKELQATLNKFKLIRLDADFAGLPTRFTTNGSFKTGIGNLEGRVNFDQVKGKPSLVSNVKVQNLDLGVLADDSELLQKISLEGRVNLTGSTLEDMLLDLDAKISQLGINGYTYSQIRTDATYGLDLFRGNLTINDPNLKAQIQGYMNLKESIDSVQLVANLDTAFLDRINLTEKPAFISGRLDINTKGRKIDDIQGIIRFNDVNLGYEDRFLELGGAYFQSLFAGGTRTLSLNSDYIVAAASGQFNLEQMFSDLQVLGSQYLAILLNEAPPVADLERNFSESYSLDLNVKMVDINPIVQLFAPDFTISKNTVLEGAFYQTPENTVFNFFTSIDQLTYQDNFARAINIDFNTSKIINSEDILASFYIYSKEQSVKNQVNFTNLGFEAIWNQDLLDLRLSLDQDSTQSKARINAEAGFSAVATTLKFKPSELQVLDRLWQFDPQNLVTLSNGEITIDNLRVINENQYLEAEGKISPNPEDILQINFQAVNIDILNTITPYQFGGIGKGNIQLSNLMEKARISGNVTVEDTEINQFPVGLVAAKVEVDDSNLILSLINEFNGVKKIDINGIIGLEYKTLDMEARMDASNLVIFEPFLSKYITKLGGTVSGNLQIRGTTDAPEVIGTGRLNDAQFHVNYLGTNYRADGSILFQPNQISFRDLVIRDVLGKRATFTGGLNHQAFKNIYLDISSRLTDFQVLNTTSRDNESFYGTAIVTGSLSIRGTTSNLDINAKVTSNANTKLFIPLTSSNEQYQEDFIQIINIQDTVRINALSEDINRLDLENIRMNFEMDVTPDASIEIIIDPKTGESIQGSGRGLLTMSVDTQGNFALSGNYEITKGKYNFSLYNVVKKDFTIDPGSRITWFGNPYEGIMSIKAFYEEDVSLQPLLTNSTGQENSQMRRRYPLKVFMNLEGELLSPNISFSFDFGEFPSSGDVQTTISAFQSRVAADDQEMNRQVFSVIMTKSFSPVGQFTGGSNITSSLSNLLSSQLNNFLGQVDKNLEINIDLATLDENALENFQLSVAYTFLDGRLRVSRDGGFTDNQGNASAASIIGDWQAEYLLTEDGVYRLRIFNRNNYNTFTSLSLSQNLLTYGASITQNVSFNSFAELFKKITGRKAARMTQIDSDDFLRQDYQQDGDWKPIDLEKLPFDKEPITPIIQEKMIPKEDDL